MTQQVERGRRRTRSLDPPTRNKQTNDENKEPSSTSTIIQVWSSRLALFGDSSWALTISFGVFLLAVTVAWHLEETVAPNSKQSDTPLLEQQRQKDDEIERAYQRLGPIPSIEPAVIYDCSSRSDKDEGESLSCSLNSTFVKEIFHRDGVIAMRGLIDPELIERLQEIAMELIEQQQRTSHKPKSLHGGKMPNPQQQQGGNTQFHTVHPGAIFWNVKQQNQLNETISNDDPVWSHAPFVEVALHSPIAKMAASLLDLDHADDSPTAPARGPGTSTSPHNNDTPLRLLRDIFLAKDEDEYICGWHVDDTGFWPATAEAPGINAWIALDDMPIAEGGGFAVAVGSHRASWKTEAYQVTGSTHTFPPEGFTSALDIVERRVGNGTCNMASSAPHLHRRMEETKRIYDVQKGDVIFHTRWLFHRTVPFVRTSPKSNRIYKRYSLRYGPGWSVVPPGYGTEPSVLWDTTHSGQTADQVTEMDEEWYPLAYHNKNDDENDGITLRRDQKQQWKSMSTIAHERLPTIREQSTARQKEMRQVRRAYFAMEEIKRQQT